MQYVVVGKNGLKATWQDDFPKTTQCLCGGIAHHVFTYIEDTPIEKKDWLACNNSPKLKKGEVWFHDVCAIANYACVKCLEVTALNNQA